MMAVVKRRFACSATVRLIAYEILLIRCCGRFCHYSGVALARVSGRVVVVVVRELFYLVTSAICVWIRGQRLRRLFIT